VVVRVALVLVLALAAVAACGAPRSSGSSGSPGSPGSSGSPGRDPIPVASAAPLPLLEYRLRSGEPWTSRAALGRVIIIDVWATYCRPCRKALPKLGRLAAAHPEAVVIGVSVDEEDAAVEAFLREVPVAFPIARDPKASVQSGPLAIHRLPTLLLIDRRGRIRFRGEEMAEPDYDVLPGLVAALLAE
jgi:thiol-disulfide isomerase/thioredoxin